MLRPLNACMTAVYLWISTQISAARKDDRGDVLPTAAIAVGLLLIAAVVLVILRNKAVDIANNICTAPDPATCQ
ncbi:hypothetical protein [Frankia sp. Cj3]|uniref:hypothetical protein n=1 Tax=Frankia sp. Cj3 TaxID=2880976 RepID=UPI001EF570BE|nr:hypothetical protein [Frankia sp. Cj3]